MKHHLFHLFGALVLSTALAAPLAAETIAECQERIIADCAEAMEDANWLEKWALGVFCTARMLACSDINVKLEAPK